MAWRLHPTGSRRTTLPVARHIERPPADGHRTAHLAAAALPPPARPRTPASTAGRRTDTGPRASRGGRFCPQAPFCGRPGLCYRPLPASGSPQTGRPSSFLDPCPRRRRDVPRSRFIVVGLVMAALVIGVALPGGADDLATAKARQKRMQAALDDATRELDQIESERSFAEQRRQAANSRLGYVRDDLAKARRALSGHVTSLYKAGGTRPLSGILGSSAEVVVSRVEFETILQEGQVEAVADAKVAYDSYEDAIRDVKAAMVAMDKLERRSKETVAKLTRTFEKAKQVADRLAGFNTTHLVNGRWMSCPLSPPYSFTDTWGAPRSGGRTHKGTDILAPYGDKVHAIVDGVISRQSSNSLGGTTLYLQGDNGAEYYYAHLSRYASTVGQRVKAGELIAYNGTSGNAAGGPPHVHFELHPGGPGSAPINPYTAVKAACP